MKTSKYLKLSYRVALGFLVASGMCITGSAQARTFGMETQEGYQNNWLSAGTGRYVMFERFSNDFDDTGDTRSFYTDLTNGAVWDWDDWGDTDPVGGLDSVDLAFVCTHGWILTDNQSVWAMWDQDVVVGSNSMRLGDDGQQLKVLTDYSCDTQQVNGFGRWWPIMDGGLRIAAGAHGHTYNGTSYYNVGKYYSDRLQAGWTITSAWGSATDTTKNNNNPSVIAAGTSSDDCFARLYNMTWGNVTDYVRYQDSASMLCIHYWVNI